MKSVPPGLWKWKPGKWVYRMTLLSGNSAVCRKRCEEWAGKPLEENQEEGFNKTAGRRALLWAVPKEGGWWRSKDGETPGVRRWVCSFYSHCSRPWHFHFLTRGGWYLVNTINILPVNSGLVLRWRRGRGCAIVEMTPNWVSRTVCRHMKLCSEWVCAVRASSPTHKPCYSLTSDRRTPLRWSCRRGVLTRQRLWKRSSRTVAFPSGFCLQ